MSSLKVYKLRFFLNLFMSPADISRYQKKEQGQLLISAKQAIFVEKRFESIQFLLQKTFKGIEAGQYNSIVNFKK